MTAVPKLILCCFSLLIGAFTILGQSFTQEITELDPNLYYPEGEYGGGVSFVDWNGDGLDDITLARNGSGPLIFTNNGNGFDDQSMLIPTFAGESKAVVWVDFDNDQDKDLFVTRYKLSSLLFRNDDGQFTEIAEEAGFPDDIHETFGACWGDYDRDGFLDVYLCNYNVSDEVTNYLYRNNGDGTFENVTEQLGVGNGSKTTFLALWLDYDHDGWPDLFVGNDRTNFFNTMYHNDGGTFTDVTEEIGLYDNIWTMTATAGDYDNDGDLDLFCTNAWTGQHLYNQGEDGTFTNVAQEQGIFDENFAWAGQWLDHNLNGWQDLYVCYSMHTPLPGENQMLINTGVDVFLYDNSMGFAESETESHASAVGDWNNDGIYDIMVYNEHPSVAKLYTSDNSGENNYLKVNLEGVYSNADGIGSFITVWGNGMSQMRHTYCGEGYLTQNSETEIFGMGDALIADSIQVEWPSGLVDMVYNVDVNQTITIEEGAVTLISLADQGPYEFCEGDSVAISVAGYDQYLWSNGDTTETTYVSTEGEIWVNVSMNSGIEFQSDTAAVIQLSLPEIMVNVDPPSCHNTDDGSIELSNSSMTGMTSVQWDVLQDTATVSGLSTGEYAFWWTDSLGCTASGVVEMIAPDTLMVAVETTDVSCFGGSDGSAELEILNAQGDVNVDFPGDIDALEAGTYELTVTDSVGCETSEQFVVDQPEEITVEIETVEVEGGFICSFDADGGTPPFTVMWSDGSDMEVNEDLEEGDHSLTITDANGCTWQADFNLTSVGVYNRTSADIKVFPNPWSFGSLAVESSFQWNFLRLVSMDGRDVMKVNFDDLTSSRVINLPADITAGTYVILISNDEGAIVRQKLTIDR